jgi:hypothetical protein
MTQDPTTSSPSPEPPKLIMHGLDGKPLPLNRTYVAAREVPLPSGVVALMYTREQVVYILKCSHGELGRLLRAKMAPLPIRVEGQILFYVDETLAAQAATERTLQRWRKR